MESLHDQTIVSPQNTAATVDPKWGSDSGKQYLFCLSGFESFQSRYSILQGTQLCEECLLSLAKPRFLEGKTLALNPLCLVVSLL